jgi:class 3 adenylate cyclase
MFCDLVGSTSLAASLDPEDLRDLVRAYHACCADIVGKFDGSVAQYLGDGVMVRFGYPGRTRTTPSGPSAAAST